MKITLVFIVAALLMACSTKNMNEGPYEIVGVANYLLPGSIFKPTFKNDVDANKALNQALENNSKGVTTSWDSTRWKIHGSITPWLTYQRVDDLVYCREFSLTWKMSGSYASLNTKDYTACRVGGVWLPREEITYGWGGIGE